MIIYDKEEFIAACNEPDIDLETLVERFNIAPASVRSRVYNLRKEGRDMPEIHSRSRIEKAKTPDVEPEGNKPWDKVKAHFGFRRVKRCPKRGFLLDGRPVTVHYLMKEAGAI